MNAISRLFDSIRQFSNPQGQAPRRRRRRQQPHSRLINGETLEPKQLLAVDLASPFADQVLLKSDPVTIAITNQFDVTDVLGTVVKFETNAPVGSAGGLTTNDFYVELYDTTGSAGTLTPTTVSNFLSYVDDGSYDNSKIHRSVSDFVIQGGGFTAPSVAADQPGSDPVAIPTKGTITNEPGNSNLRGTLAMAKLGGQPNSATSQWFVNLSDNTFLDTDNGGYAVFGEVLGDGMTVVDVMAGALTYDATTYYSNGAFSDLPLWNVNADNIVLPQDFVKIETITELSDESELLEYSVTTSDTSKLTASINAAGDLVLTPVAGQTGSVSVTVTATSKTDGSTKSDTFAVELGGDAGGGGGGEDPAPTLTAIETAGDVTLSRDADGLLYAGEVQITLNGAAIDYNKYKAAGMEALAAEDLINGNANALLWKLGNGSVYHWAFDENWSRIGTFGLYAPGTSGFNQAEVDFGVDLGAISLQPLEQTGNVVLNVDPQGNLYANQRPLTFNGSLINSTAYANAGMTAVAVESNVGGHNALAWRLSDGSVYQWRFDADWSRTEAYGRHATSTAGYYATEEAFVFDIDQDGTIGPVNSLTPLENRGAVVLNTDGNGDLYAGTKPLLLSGNRINFNRYANGGMTAIAVESDINQGNILAWRLADGSVYRWKFDTNWNRTEVLGGSAPGTNEFYEAEDFFGEDIDDDDFVGTVTTIEQAGSIALRIDARGVLHANSTPLNHNGVTINYEAYANGGMTAVAVETTTDGSNTLVWRLADGAIYQWRFDSTWNRTEAFGRHARETAEFYDAERAFETDIDEDGFVGSVTTIEQSGLVTLRVDDHGVIYAGSTALRFNNAPIDFNLYSAGGMTAIAADNVEGVGNVLLWRLADGAVYNWKFDENWNRTEAFGRYAPGSADFYETERTFGVDADNDRFTGANEVIEQVGTNRLQKDLDGNLHVDGIPVTLNGAAVNYNVYQTGGMTAIAADVHPENGNTLLWRLANGNIYHWSFDASWSRTGTFGMYTPDNFAASNAEVIFGISLSDTSLTPIETNGAFSLQVDAAGYLRANGSILRLNNSPISFDAFANGGMTAVAFESTSEGNVLLWRLNSGYAYQWEFNDQFARTRAFGLYAPGTTEFQQLESAFEVTISA